MQLPAAFQVNLTTQIPADAVPHTTRAALQSGARRVYRYILILFVPALLGVLFYAPLPLVSLISIPLVFVLRWLAFGSPIPTTRVNTLVLVFAASVLWSLLRTPNLYDAALAATRLLVGMTLMYLIADYAESPGRLWNIVGALVIAGVLAAILAPFLTSPAPEKLVDVTHLFRPSLLGLEVSDPNMFAGVLATMVPLAMALILSGERWLVRIGSVALAPLLIMLLLLQTRGAWIAAVSGLVIYLSLYRRLFIALIPLTLFVLWFLNANVKEITATLPFQVNPSDGLISLQGRQQVWDFTAREIVRDPAGHGISSFTQYANNLASDGLTIPQRQHAHNLFLQAGFETGLVGLGAFAAVWAYAFFASWHAVSRQVKRNLAIGVFAALFVALLSTLLESNMWSNVATLVLWALFGMAVVLGRYGSRRRRTGRVRGLQEVAS